MNSFYRKDELAELGLGGYGQDVFISKKASIYSPGEVFLANRVRIDDFCILSGSIKIGSGVHISAFTALYGSHGIEMEDFSGLSPRCTVFSATDDFSGGYMIGPMAPRERVHIIGGRVLIKKYAQIGAGSVVLPDLVVGEGVAVGAMSLINKSLDDWGVYAGIPARLLKKRKMIFGGEDSQSGLA